MSAVRNYEAMFLLDNQAAQADFDGTAGKVDALFERHGAKIVQKEKWDERKLAYEIKGQRRATYYLVYFSAPPAVMAGLREDIQLTEVVLRHLMLTLDEPIETHIQTRAEERERLAEDSRKQSAVGWGPGGAGGGRRRRDRRGRDGDDDEDFDPGDLGDLGDLGDEEPAGARSRRRDDD